MQFMNSILDALVKNLSADDFKYLSQEFRGDLLNKKECIHKINYPTDVNFIVL